MNIFGIDIRLRKKKEEKSDIQSKKTDNKYDKEVDIKSIMNVQSDYIQCIPRYKNFVHRIQKEGWIRIGDMTEYSLTHHNINFTATYLAEKGMYNRFLDITCPSGNYKITICGFAEACIDPTDFYAHSNLYSIPHFFSILCTDNNRKEMSPNITIDIEKNKINGTKVRLYTEYYGDLSQKVDGRLKRKEERYYFSNGIILNSGERLLFNANKPDIDITKTELLMKADLFFKDIDN